MRSGALLRLTLLGIVVLMGAAWVRALPADECSQEWLVGRVREMGHPDIQVTGATTSEEGYSRFVLGDESGRVHVMMAPSRARHWLNKRMMKWMNARSTSVTPPQPMFFRCPFMVMPFSRAAGTMQLYATLKQILNRGEELGS